MKIGYIRVSKQEQNETFQRDALKEAHREKYFSDKMTGAKFERKGLEELLAFMRSGDTMVVWKLDRLGRSLKDLVETLNLLCRTRRSESKRTCRRSAQKTFDGRESSAGSALS